MAPKRAKSGIRSKPAKRARRAATPYEATAPTERLNVFMMGSGENCELGFGPKGKRLTSAPRPRLNRFLDAATVGVVQVAVGGMHCLALTHDGKVMTWGVNDNGALGRDTPPEELESDPDSDDEDALRLNPHESTPTAIPADSFAPGTTIVQVAASDTASFALTSTGLVYGWGTFRAGDGIFGFLRSGIASDTLAEKKPVLIPGISNVRELSAGGNHVLALTNDGKVFAWGSGDHNELGRRVFGRRRYETLVPTQVGFRRNRTARIFAGSHHSFAVDERGRVWAWGLNNFGQTGVPTSMDTGFTSIVSPVIVRGLADHNIVDMAGGEHHSLACTADGKLLAWGRCDESQMGMDLSGASSDIIFDARDKPRVLNAPAEVPGLPATKYVGARIDNSFAVCEDGKAYSWGYSDSYRTGLGTEDTVQQPTEVRSRDLNGKTVDFVGCGGQFAVLAGPQAVDDQANHPGSGSVASTAHIPTTAAGV